ncbi:MAG: DUF2974 domain-containing protein [Clostridiales bacterium]|nr:DUF2974 domain-containing protein [Clostridiales bacterium]
MHLVDYVLSVSTKTFSQLPFNEVDALVFAQISYYDYSVFEDGISFEEIRGHKNLFKATDLKNLIGKEDEKLFNVVIGSRRYEKTIVKNHKHILDQSIPTQFCATTFINKKKAIIAYRGTDGTVIGWNEDMNMTYQFPIEGQVLAQKYINKVLPELKSYDVKVVGHSKGGNLAIYASVMANKKYQDLISGVYNFDGPGFVEAFYALDAFSAIKDRIHKFVPVQSTVGKMMLNQGNYKVVKSDKARAMQHWAHSWLIDGTHFDYADETDFFSASAEAATDNVLVSMTKEERRDAVTEMFNILYSTECHYMDDIIKNMDGILYCLKEYIGLKERGANVKKLFLELVKPMVQSYYQKEKDIATAKFSEKKDELVEKVKNFFKKDENN